MSITAAAKRGKKKFQDVPISNRVALADVAKILICEFPWLPKSIDLTNKTAAAEFIHRRLFGASIALGEGLKAIGVEAELRVIGPLNGGGSEVLTRWPYGEVAKAIVAANDLQDTVPAAVKSPAARELPKPLSTGVMLSLQAMTRHPANRTPATADIAARAHSLEADGQLEEIVVRQTGVGRYQIISGETRTLAAQSLGWTELRSTVIECDDAEALRLVGLYNGQRMDLNPIQKAQHIEAMHKAGMTREEAGRCVGLESGSAASNLVRLLKLPKVWQDRVASGELPESFARDLLPAVPIEAAMKEAEQEFKENSDVRWGFRSRAAVVAFVEELLFRHTRRLDSTKRRYGGDYQRELGSWEAMGEYPCLLAADEIEANRAKLKIVTIVADGKEVEVATNCKLFDELQCAIIKKQHEAKAKKQATAAGKKADAGEKVSRALGWKPTKSPDMIKHEAAVRAADRKRDVNSWRDRLLRREISAAIRATKIKTPDPKLMTLVMAFLLDHHSSFTPADLFPIAEQSLRLDFDDHDDNPYRALAPYLNSGASLVKWQNLAVAICAFLVGGDADHDRPAAIDSETLQALFDEWGCDLTAAWRKLHAAKDPLLEEFFELHRKDELRELGKEVAPDLHLAETLGKPQMVKLILGRTLPPAVPKCLLPAKKRETGAKGQATGARKRGARG